MLHNKYYNVELSTLTIAYLATFIYILMFIFFLEHNDYCNALAFLGFAILFLYGIFRVDYTFYQNQICI